MSNDSDWLNNAVVELQTQSAFQAENIEAMEKTIAEQHYEIQLLNKQIKILSQHIKSLRDDAVKDVRDEQPPPHY